MYSDGGGLYLRVTKERNKSWVFRFMLAGKARWMGIGPLHIVSLTDARSRAVECRALHHNRIDPIDARRAERLRTSLDAARTITFAQCAATYIASHRTGWQNAKHAAQWEATLKTYAEPVIGGLPVQGIDTTLVLKVLEPIWSTKPETASRLRGRIEQIIDWAKVRGYRLGENPARWRGHMDKLLPAKSKVRRVVHHAALPWAALPGFLASVRAQKGDAARALEFAILTVARTGEIIAAAWSEIDIGEKVWVIPADRMKGGREHRVPLSRRALAILDEMKPAPRSKDAPWPTETKFIFGNAGRPLSNMALLMLLRRMGHSDLTTHGFRSTFRDWAAEQTDFPGDVAEMALAHVVGSKVEAAYRRGDLFEKRRQLMEDWAAFCEGPPMRLAIVKP
jgi:integrase